MKSMDQLLSKYMEHEDMFSFAEVILGNLGYTMVYSEQNVLFNHQRTQFDGYYPDMIVIGKDGVKHPVELGDICNKPNSRKKRRETIQNGTDILWIPYPSFKNHIPMFSVIFLTKKVVK